MSNASVVQISRIENVAINRSIRFTFGELRFLVCEESRPNSTVSIYRVYATNKPVLNLVYVTPETFELHPNATPKELVDAWWSRTGGKPGINKGGY